MNCLTLLPMTALILFYLSYFRFGVFGFVHVVEYTKLVLKQTDI